MSSFVNNRAACKQEVIVGRCYGKDCCSPSPGDCRAILPLPALLTLADIMLSTRVNKWIQDDLMPRSTCFIGALPGTQCLDISHSVQLVVKKALDIKSRGAVATADIRRYYDSLNMLRVARFLVSRGCDAATVAACIRCQIDDPDHLEPLLVAVLLAPLAMCLCMMLPFPWPHGGTMMRSSLNKNKALRSSRGLTTCILSVTVCVVVCVC